MKFLYKILLFLFLIPIAIFSKGCKDNLSTEPLIEKLNQFEVTKNIEWANPNGHSLTMDIYVPKTGKETYPVLVIFHGGGWLINNNTVMDSMSTYIVQHGDFIVCNVNYRLLVDELNTVKMNEIVEDAMGAVLWIKEHIEDYNGDPNKIIVTGDSAGGHLAEMIIVAGKMLESDGFNGDTFGFNPTYLPYGQSPEDVAANNGLEVQAAILSYPAFDIYEACLDGMEKQSNIFWMLAQSTPRGIFGNNFNLESNPDMYKAVSANYLILEKSDRNLPPHILLVGSKDNLTTPASVKAYIYELEAKGHSAEYWEHEGRPHAFLDSWKNEFLGTEFRKDAPPALEKMLEFMNGLFWK